MQPSATIVRTTLQRGLRRLRASVSVPHACRPDLDGVLRAHVRALAPVLALLTAGWILLDRIALPAADVPSIALVRCGMALALLGLGRMAHRLPAASVVRSFVWLQAAGFGLIQLALIHDRTTSLGIGYGLFPFVVAAQLALFPRTWWQTLRTAAAPAAMLALAEALDGRPFDLEAWNDVWLLALLVFVGAWTAQAQLDLLVGLLGARQEATHDALTGLANRRQADASLEAERSRCLRHGETLSVLMGDLDHFKRINDRYGHAAGDLVLAAAAGAIAAELRGSDVGARYGGEEFVVLLPETTIDEAMPVAERIRARVEQLRIDVGDAVVMVTMSLGVATLRGDEPVERLLARADTAMYAAKDGGRNRCIAAREDAPAAVPAA